MGNSLGEVPAAMVPTDGTFILGEPGQRSQHDGSLPSQGRESPDPGQKGLRYPHQKGDPGHTHTHTQGTAHP